MDLLGGGCCLVPAGCACGCYLVRQQITAIALDAAELFCLCATVGGSRAAKFVVAGVLFGGAAAVFFLTGFSVCSSGDYEIICFQSDICLDSAI
ncbi:transmembrane protein, putative [Medicago truncatula]|uniref:Transmembrane protein, putative n=1 Tax=Medicago truncatula TaxID=3880 RepID=A0A072UA04_MEDTR|nr:transmembrane protein, putative [Medicago truncatula]